MKTQILDNRSVLSISGKDKFDFLQGLITNDINALEEGKMLYALMLNPQGRFLYDFFITLQEENIFIDHESDFTKEITSKLNLYKLRSDVHIKDCSQEYQVVSSQGSLEALSYEDPRDERIGFRSYISTNSELKGGSSRYDELMYEYTIPDPHKDMIRERSFPLEYGLDKFNAISFEKGCYMGQENTARTKHRGTIRKKLVKFISEKEIQNIEKGEEVFSNSKKVGIFCSARGKVGKMLIRTDSEVQDSCNLNILGCGIRVVV
ncbi:MAG: hypothetical protein K0T99_02185 [Alphaproteobacteria bacterium]|nr:hypothetical protein [Alphaproteobacteria bacterium]